MCAVTELRSVEYDVILPADVVCKLKATQGMASVSLCKASDVCDESGSDVNEVCDVNVEGGTPEAVTGEDPPEDVCSMPVTGIEVCVTECDVNSENVAEFGSIVISTPARVSCNVTSVRGEETEVLRHSLEPRLESIPPLEESRDRLGAYSGRRGEEVRRSQETADLGSRRTRTRGSQDVTTAVYFMIDNNCSLQLKSYS